MKISKTGRKLAGLRAAAIAGTIAATAGGGAMAQTDLQLTESRNVIDQFASRLQAALGAAMADGGPVAAVEVCKDIAPQLASELSRTSGARVGRTTLQTRNPINAPDEWQTRVLGDFERAIEDGTAPETLERFERMDDGSARYMRAIRIAPTCVLCHGETVAPPVDEIIGRLYPHDRALGYALGDLRGAFAVTWPSPRDADAAGERD